MLTMNPFKKPTIEELRSKELDEAQRNLLLAEQQRDYYIHTINYLTARIQALETKK